MRTYDRSRIQPQLLKIGDFPVYDTVFPNEPEGETPWGTIWEQHIDKDQESNMLIMTHWGWVDTSEVFNGDPINDKSVTYEYIKSELEAYEEDCMSDHDCHAGPESGCQVCYDHFYQ